MRGLCALMLWPQPDDVGTILVNAVARRRRGTHDQVLALIDELVAMGTQRRRMPSTPAVTSATIAPSTAPAMTSPG